MGAFKDDSFGNKDAPTGGIILINPPIVDPTMPPHFAAYLAGALREAGLNCNLRFDDLNILILDYLTSRRGFEIVERECNALIRSIGQKTRISKLDELRYKKSFQIIGLSHERIMEARDILVTESKFYDFGRYQGAATLISRYIDATTAMALPGMFSFWELEPSAYGSLSSIEDLSDKEFIGLLCKPFQPFLKSYLDDVAASSPDLIGISCNYISQLPYVIYIAQKLLSRKSNLNICIGGTELTDVYKNVCQYMDLWKIFPRQVALVVGEGESAFTTLATACLSGASVSEAHTHHQNIVTASCLSRKNSALVENINKIGKPDYSIYKLADYWSPEPVLLYSPTRGCYWNKCTFCDYGLNFNSPTSPSRERDLKGLHDDLLSIARISKAMYVAVDAISPRFLLRLSDMIKHSQIQLSWSAEIRLEKKIASDHLAQALREAGCVGLSFGFESGSQRILKLINKGVDLELVPELLSAISRQGIHVQLMGFTGFPTETKGEASETFQFLERHQHFWSFAGIGSFVLTPGSIIAKSPSDFGVTELISDDGGISRSLKWMDGSDLHISGDRHDSIRREYAGISTRVSLSRPYFGGIDTAHSILYFRRYPGVASLLNILKTPRADLVGDQIIESEFSNFIRFLDPDDLKSELKNYRPGRFKFVMEWLSIDRLIERKSQRFTIKPSGRIYLTSEASLPSWISAHFT